MKPFTYPGNIYIIAAPSGTGKSTLLTRLVAEDRNLVFSISHTTRQPRSGEVDGKDYFFVTDREFGALVKAGAFLEWAEVHGHKYGTGRANLEQLLIAGTDVVLDVDVVGAASVKKQLPSAVGIFILPPSYGQLRERLINRGKDSAEVIERRLRNAREEIRHCLDFDFILVNGDLEACYRELCLLVSADRLRAYRRRQSIGKIIESFSDKR